MPDCKDIVESRACFLPNDLTQEVRPLIRISKYSESTGGPPVTTYVLGDGTNTVIDRNVFLGGGLISDGPCAEPKIRCRESQEWTYAIDNTGTNFRWPAARYRLTLSDGSILEWDQTTDSNPGWSNQLIEWATNIQDAADNAGLAWTVQPRFVALNNLTGGGGGLLGAPSEAIGQQLYDQGMRARYLNFQICAGDPVPVQAELIEVSDSGGFAVPALPRILTATEAAILGPKRKFQVCTDCRGIEKWNIYDGTLLRPATESEIPNCWEPCGTLVNSPPPPESLCTFDFSDGCDNGGQTDPNNFIPVTRRVSFCEGQAPSVDYFQEIGGVLEDYTLVGAFVDCASGDPVPQPANSFAIVPKCSDHTGTAVVTPVDTQVQTITVTAELGQVEFSTDGGTTWCRMDKCGSRTWGDVSEDIILDISLMRFRGVTADSNFDLIWEV